MRNKRGFTLVELIAVIAILAVIIVLITPSITNIAKSSKVSLRESKINTLITAAENYGNDLINNYQQCINGYNSLGTNCTVNIDELINKGYIETDQKDSNVILDPETNTPLNGNLLLCYNPKDVSIYATYSENGVYACGAFSLNSDNTLNLSTISGNGYIGGSDIIVSVITGGEFISNGFNCAASSDGNPYIDSCKIAQNRMTIKISKNESLTFPDDNNGIKYKNVPITVSGKTKKGETLSMTYTLRIFPTYLQLGSPADACLKFGANENINLNTTNTGSYNITSDNPNILTGYGSGNRVTLTTQNEKGIANITITENNGNKKVELKRKVYQLEFSSFEPNLTIRENKQVTLLHGGSGEIKITSSPPGKIQFSTDGVNFQDTLILPDRNEDNFQIRANNNGAAKVIVQGNCSTLEPEVTVSSILIKNPDGSDYILNESGGPSGDGTGSGSEDGSGSSGEGGNTGSNNNYKEIFIGGSEIYYELESNGNHKYTCEVIDNKSSATCRIENNHVIITPGSKPSNVVTIKVGIEGDPNNYSIIKVKVTETSLRLVDENDNIVTHQCVENKANKQNEKRIFVKGENLGEVTISENPLWYLAEPTIKDDEVVIDKRYIEEEEYRQINENEQKIYKIGYNTGVDSVIAKENFGNKTAKLDYHIYDLQLSETEGIVAVGGTVTFDVSAYSTGDISVSSDNTSVARVSVKNPSSFDYGVNRANISTVTVTGIRAGETTIKIHGSKCGEATYTIIVDNGAPECNFDEFNSQYLANGKTTKVTLTCTDESGFRRAPSIKPDNFTISDSDILEVTNVSSGTAIDKGYSYQVTIRGKGYGYSYITLNAGVVSDRGGNTNRAVSSNSLLITEYDPEEIWEIGANWAIDVQAILYDNADYKNTNDNTYTLKIYGTGAANMIDYTSSRHAPWYQNYRNRITDVEFNDEVSNVGNYAFYNMPNLKSVTMSSITEYIGDYAFNNSGLETINIPANVDTIGNYAFYGNGYNSDYLKSITFETDSILNKIGNYAFYGHHATSINIPNEVNTIGNFAFYQDIDGSTLTRLNFDTNSSINTIGNYAFYNHSLTELNIPSSVNTIGNYSFYNENKTLESLEFSNNSQLQSIGDYAFQNSNINSIIFPSSLKQIGNYSFNNVPIENLTFNENSRLEFIGSGAFANTKVSSIHLGARVNTLGTLFVSSTNFTEFNVDPSNPYITQENGVLYDKNKTRLLRVPDKYGSIHDELIMPDTVKTIENYAIGGITFKNEENTFKLVLASGIEELNEETNFRYSPVNEFAITDGVNFKVIDGVLFDQEGKTLLIIPTAYKKTSYEIPEGTISIREYAGYGQLNIDNLTIPASVTSIEDYAFFTDYGFKIIELNTLEDANIEYTAFYSDNIDKTRNITVHYESLKDSFERNLSGYPNIKIVYIPIETEESESNESK